MIRNVHDAVHHREIYPDVRLRVINERWIASADTPDGPSLGLGGLAMEAIEEALVPFEGIADELLASVPRTGLR